MHRQWVMSILDRNRKVAEAAGVKDPMDIYLKYGGEALRNIIDGSVLILPICRSTGT